MAFRDLGRTSGVMNNTKRKKIKGDKTGLSILF